MAIGKIALTGAALGAAWYVLPGREDGRSQTFAVPAATAVDRLGAKSRLVEGTGMGSLTIASAGTDGQALLIGVTRAGAPRSVKCRVTITPVAPAESNATVDCTQTAGQDAPARDVAVKAVTMVVREHVAATVEARPYDIEKVADRMITLVAMNAPSLAASIKPPRE